MLNACSRNWRIAIMVPWLAFAAMLVDIARAYRALPAVIASHFNAAGIPNGFAPKDSVFMTIGLVSLGLLCLFTFLLSRFPQISGLGWLLMISEFWGIGLLVGLTHATLRVGLGEAKTLEFPIGVWSLIMGGALVVGEIGRINGLRRRADSGHGHVIAQEVHSSPAMAMVFVAITLGIIGFEVFLDLRGPARAVPVIVAVLLLGCAVWAYTGFVYRISTAGLEIRVLGVPVRFLAAADIASFAAEETNRFAAGWGIRGIGRLRVYRWSGNRYVHIRTTGGEDLYLANPEADRMVHAMGSMVPVTR